MHNKKQEQRRVEREIRANAAEQAERYKTPTRFGLNEAVDQRVYQQDQKNLRERILKEERRNRYDLRPVSLMIVPIYIFLARRLIIKIK